MRTFYIKVSTSLYSNGNVIVQADKTWIAGDGSLVVGYYTNDLISIILPAGAWFVVVDITNDSGTKLISEMVK